MPEQLKWGQTPWDTLSREKLLIEVWRMHAALLSAHSALKICGNGNTAGFWSLSGTGGRGLEMTRQALEPVKKEYGEPEPAYRTFFRYACDLLFSSELGSNWTVCDGCDVLLGAKDLVGQPCTECARAGRQSVRRLLEWRDLLSQRMDGVELLTMLMSKESKPNV